MKADLPGYEGDRPKAAGRRFATATVTGSHFTGKMLRECSDGGGKISGPINICVERDRRRQIARGAVRCEVNRVRVTCSSFPGNQGGLLSRTSGKSVATNLIFPSVVTQFAVQEMSPTM